MLIRDQGDGRLGPFTMKARTLKEMNCAQIEIAEDLTLIDLTGDGPFRMGVPTDVVGARDQKLAREWSAAFHAHERSVDGIYYPSRLNEERNIALYDRALHKLRVMRENLEEGDRWCRNITTVHLVVEADSDAQADDAIYEMLSNNLMFRTAKPDTTPLLLDWAFLNDAQTCCEPSRMPDGVPDDLEDVYLTPREPAANAMINAVSLVRDLARMVTPRDPDQIADYCKEYGKDPADMTEDDLEEMESDLENDRVWSDALASYQMIRSAREIVKALTMAARENNASVVDTQSPVADAAAPAI